MKRILLIEDDHSLREEIVNVLELEEFEVVTAENGRIGLERLKEGLPDLVLCDLMMPDMTGMDLFADLSRSAPQLAERVVFMTGGVFTPRAREFLERVPNPRIEKPFDWDQLRAIVRKLLDS